MFYMTGDLSASGANPVPGQLKKEQTSVQEDGGGKQEALRNADFILIDQ